MGAIKFRCSKWKKERGRVGGSSVCCLNRKERFACLRYSEMAMCEITGKRAVL